MTVQAEIDGRMHDVDIDGNHWNKCPGCEPVRPYWHDESLTVYQGDCRAVMAALPAESVHAVVTSPPYWGLRDYGLPSAVWGGDPAHVHVWGSPIPPRPGRGNKPGEFSTSSLTNPDRQDEIARPADAGQFCACGAWFGTLGLEPSPAQYVANIVEVFRGVRRVLREDGTVWLNLGDSYASSSTYNTSQTMATENGWKQDGPKRPNVTAAAAGLKPKDLVGIPWRVAFALQEDGWYLRCDVIWSKPNPMPESVEDRPTKSHEYLFLLSRNDRYFYDHVAVKEPLKYLRAGKSVRENHAFGEVAGRPLGAGSFATVPSGRNLRSVWEIATRPYPGAHFATFPRGLVEPCIKASTPERGVCPECGTPWVRQIARSGGRDWRNGNMAESGLPGERNGEGGNKRGRPDGPLNDVQSITTLDWHPGCRHGGDWSVIRTPVGDGPGPDFHAETHGGSGTGRRGLDRQRFADEGTRPMYRWEQAAYAAQLRVNEHRDEMEAAVGEERFAHYIRTDWSGARAIPPDDLFEWLDFGWLTKPEPPEAPVAIPATVLDPFGGSGTTGMVAQALGRRAILIDLSVDYLDQIMARNAQMPLVVG